MNVKMSVLAISCAMALAACGNNNAPQNKGLEGAPQASATAPTNNASDATMATDDAAMSGSSMSSSTEASANAASTGADSGDQQTAVVNDCATTITGNDAMQYDVSSIVVPSSCEDFKITLKHIGKMPKAAMGHDVVITKKSDMAAVDAAGATAGLDNGYLKPDDSRVIAHTDLVGGGEETSVSFPVSKIQGDGPYVFFCSFPGHSATMHGSISVQ